MKRLLTSSMLVILTLTSFAQGKLGVFVGVGTMFYQGDLVETPIVPAPTVSWTVDAGLHWQFHRRWAAQLNYTAGDIKGNDAYALSDGRRARGFAFQSYEHELSLRALFYILRADRFRLVPYLTAGVGGLYSDQTINAANAATVALEGDYSPFTVSFPTGVGLMYQISCPWAIKAEGVYHWTLSDHVDGVSVSPRGNPSQKDGFWDINIGVIWFFTGCKNNRKGGLLEDCERLYKDVDMDKLQRQYGQ
jgi:opacity protein-like surface antigen